MKQLLDLAYQTEGLISLYEATFDGDADRKTYLAQMIVEHSDRLAALAHQLLDHQLYTPEPQPEEIPEEVPEEAPAPEEEEVEDDFEISQSALFEEEMDADEPAPAPEEEPLPAVEVEEPTPIVIEEPAPIVIEEPAPIVVDDDPLPEDDDLQPAENHNIPEPLNDVNSAAARARKAESFLQAFPLNDRYRFMRELFGNSMVEFKEAANLIETMQTPEEAEEYFFTDLQWDAENEVVDEFIRVTRNYILSK